MKVSAYKLMLDERNIPMLCETGEKYRVDGRTLMSDPSRIARLLLDEVGLGNEAEEHVYVLCLNTENRLIGLFEASHGGYDSAQFPVREIFAKSLMLGASRIVVAHNHPSGNLTPSKEDIATTGRIREAGKLLELPVLDHLIVGRGQYLSFMEQGMMNS